MKLGKIVGYALLILVVACSTKKDNQETTGNYKLNKPLVYFAEYDEGYPITDEDIDEDAAYKTKDFIEYYSDFYSDKSKAPDFNFEVDLSTKSFHELRLIRAEILARHGFLFMDYVFRSYFNATKWYQPVFWYNDFQFKLSEKEKAFIAKVVKLEKAKYQQNYVMLNGAKMANLVNVVNRSQFDKIPEEMLTHLKKDGFVINKSKYEQLFHAYDENYYDYTPSFITTDLFLQLLHMHISKEMQVLEKEKMISIVSTLVKEQYQKFQNLAKTSTSLQVKNAAEWNQVYYAIALSLISNEKQIVPDNYKEYFNYEWEHTSSGQGDKSNFLGDSLIDYTQFQPRGNYTLSDSLKNYFKCVKWLNTAVIYLDEDNGLDRAILLANSILESKDSQKNYETFASIIQFLAGDENNLSIQHLISILKTNGFKTIDEMLLPENKEIIRRQMYLADPKRMKPRSVNEKTKEFLSRKKMVFTAGRYTFDGEILSRLVEISQPVPKRPFPKSLDVLAAMGNNTAETILLNQYQENLKWDKYKDSLNQLKKKFIGFNKWDLSIYNKNMEVILALQKANSKYPYFMQTTNWQKKNINAMLGSYTGLKHDMVLYIEQPSGAEMGDGGEVPPPQKLAYVEPNLVFWNTCISLLNLNKKVLLDNNLPSDKLKVRNEEISNIAKIFVRISTKELAKKRLSNLEFDTLSFIGGDIERLTLDIIESNEGQISSVTSPERNMAIAADIYTYRDKCLTEANGYGDEIYVLAEINGLLYLTRGAVFGNYEFLQDTGKRLTDEDWQKQLADGEEPEMSIWMKDIKINIERPKIAPNFNLY